VFKIKEREQEIEIERKLHRYIKENFLHLYFKVPFMKDGNECKSNETYLFDKDLFNDLGNIIQSIYLELYPLSKSAKTNFGYISDNGFIVNDNKIIYNKKRKFENNTQLNYNDNDNDNYNLIEKNYKFKAQDEKEISNLDKYCGYENDGFIVDDDEELSGDDNVSESSIEYESSELDE
jgi:hypothetical protein